MKKLIFIFILISCTFFYLGSEYQKVHIKNCIKIANDKKTSFNGFPQEITSSYTEKAGEIVAKQIIFDYQGDINLCLPEKIFSNTYE